VDLIQTRIPLEMLSASCAAGNASEEDLAEMRRLLNTAGQNLDNDEMLNAANMGFHRQIALASGNTVLVQLLDVLQDLFTEEQRLILGILGSRERDHNEHLGILESLERRDEKLVIERMREHLEGVRKVLLQWNPDDHPVI
jgi:GntR family transcriptional repressor for pyruvate dehydrogenase complex